MYSYESGPDMSYLDSIKAFFEKQRMEREQRQAQQQQSGGGGMPMNYASFGGGASAGASAGTSAATSSTPAIGGSLPTVSGSGVASAATKSMSGFVKASPWVAVGAVGRNLQQKGTLGPDVKEWHAYVDPAGDSRARDIPKAAMKNPLKFIFPHENATKNILKRLFGGKKG